MTGRDALDEALLRGLVPQVIGVLVRRGTDFAAAEDAVQDALVEAVRTWPADPPRDPKGWLVRVASRRLVDAVRSDIARRVREDRDHLEPGAGPAEQADDTLLLLFLCCHPSLSPASAIALTLRAVGGLTTDEIAEAFLVPRATMAQRISRAKRTVADVPIGPRGDLALVLRVLYLVYHAGHGRPPDDGRARHVDLAAEAIRLTRQLTRATAEPEARGLLALMLLHHARRDARFSGGRLVPLDEQDRTRWNGDEIDEGVRVLQAALALDRRGEYQLQAAVAALHDDARTASETDWPQVLEWYDELVALTGNPVARLSRAVAVAHVLGPSPALAELDALEPELGERHRYLAARGYLLAMAGEHAAAADLYARAAARTTSRPERDHLTRRAASLRAAAAGGQSEHGGLGGDGRFSG